MLAGWSRDGEIEMDQFYEIKRVSVNGVSGAPPAYWVYSTAPLDVEQGSRKLADKHVQPNIIFESIQGSDPVDEIVAHLLKQDEPEMVLAIHGFNNPTNVAMDAFAAAYEYMAGQVGIRKKAPVCIGYHWPSEKLGKPFPSSLRAAPGCLVWQLIVSLCLVVWISMRLVAVRHHEMGWHVSLGMICLLLLSIPVTTILFRAATYFRDSYRAMHYGVPDLIELIRAIENRFHEIRTDGSKRVKLSLIGHSMGGFVVTHLVRVLTDVFVVEPRDEQPPNDSPFRDSDSPRSNRNVRVSPNLGRALSLGRMVLVSPDIPAETLMTHRANFLGPSLRRFEEVYLFSNGGDVVVGMISAIANHFSFPTSRRRYGYRLANVEVVNPKNPGKLHSGYGIVNLWDGAVRDERAARFLGRLRVGERTLAELNREMHQRLPKGKGDRPLELPELFTYFDCTDYKEGERAYLSRSKCLPKLRWYNRLSLLITYLPRRPDVHSGYFDGPFTRSLIYDIACLGFENFQAAGNPWCGVCYPVDRLVCLDCACRRFRVKALLSPDHFRRTRAKLRQSPWACGFRDLRSWRALQRRIERNNPRPT